VRGTEIGSEEALDQLLIDASQRWKRRRRCETRKQSARNQTKPRGGGGRDRTSPIVRPMQRKALAIRGEGVVQSLQESE
jgi:hypothetical protein